MSFSISKLQNLIQSNGFLTKSYFTMDGMCFYIELYSIQTGDIFYLYIPSKYNFKMSENEITFKLKYINIKDLENVDENGNIEEQYKSNALVIDPENMEDQLEDNYKQSISIKNISVTDLYELKNICKQVKRLRYSVQNLKYKLGIVYKNYICSIRRDDSLNCFYIKKYSKRNSKQIVIIVDLETFYLKLDRIHEDITIVKKSIYKILGKNQMINSDSLNNLLMNKKEILNITDCVQSRENDFLYKIEEVENMLKIMNESQKTIQNDIKNFEHGTQVDNINNDITRIYRRTQLEKEVDKIIKIKQELLSVLIELKQNCDNDFLSVDNILFDNNIAWERMMKNFSSLKEFC